MANEFDLGLNIASIETELPDPVITLTGSDNLTASETAEMPLLALTAYGRSTQGYASHGGEPLGKNLLDPSLFENYSGAGVDYINNGDGTFTVKGTATDWAGNVSDVFILPKGTYMLSTPNKTSQINVSVSDGVENYYAQFTLSDATEVKVIMQAISGATVDTTFTIQLEKGDTATEYEPYYSKPNPEYPVPIESIGDSGSLMVTTGGKNLFDFEAWKNTVGIKGGKVNYTNNSVELIATENDCFTSGQGGSNYTAPTYQIKTKPNTQYTLSWSSDNDNKGYVYAFIDGKVSNSKSQNNSTAKHLTFATSASSSYVLIRFGVSNVGESITYGNIQFEEGLAVTNYEPYKSTTAKIATALPLRGIPVSSGGNYTDSNGQEWVCDTLEHIYGEPAQAVKRIRYGKAEPYYDLKGGGAIAVEYIYDGYDENGQNKLAGYRHYIGEYGKTSTRLTAYWANVYNCFYKIEYDLDGNITSETAVEPYTASPYLQGIYELVGNWTLNHGSLMIQTVLPAYVLPGRVTAEYISTTGETLTADSMVAYVSEPENVLLTTEETEKLNGLSGFTGSTTIYNDSTAEMTVKLLREDFEMQYIHWIKESQSYVCEKAGKYKIICVGGGSSGGIGATGAAEIMQAAGTTTSFGAIISAEGGGKSRALVGSMHIGSGALIGGQSGYDGINYGSTSHVMTYESAVHFSSTGSNSSVMWGTGHGYGAGGGARSYSDDLLAAGGRCGKVESTIVDLEENQTIACTIGGGGVLKLSDANVLDYIKTYVNPEKASATGEGEKVSACVSDGADGVIIIQYLGV